MKTIIKNATIINEGKTFKASVLIKNDIIEQIIYDESFPQCDQTIDAEGLMLFPGVIDDQVHFRQPGLTHKADIYTESKAAIAGGITSFMEMPNTNPQTVSIDLLEQKFKLASEVSLANYSFYIGATNNNISEILKADPSKVCGIKCFMGSSTGNMLVEGEGLSTLFKNAHMLVATHCEEEAIVKANTEKYFKQYGENIPIEFHPKIRSSKACFQSTSKAVELAHKYNTRLHVLHLSTAIELDLFSKGDIKNKKISNEVCVHHLWFDDSDYAKNGALIKWNPAVKTSHDKHALQKALQTGLIDIVATDHAPHTIYEKNNTYLKAPSGGPLVQHSLVAMLEMVKNGIFTYELIVEKMCHHPAILFNVKKRGYIRNGYKADLILISDKNPWTVNQSNILYKCGWSPFNGQNFSHKIISTFVNGKLVYNNGKFDETQKGERLQFDR